MAPFVVLMALVALDRTLPETWSYPLRAMGALAALLVFSRHVVSLRPAHPFASMALGLAVFAIWMGPDLLWPGYRDHWLFQNWLSGSIGKDGAARHSAAQLLFRIAGSVLVVPPVEELFWRGWFMRWLISPRFESVPLGTWSAHAFWITAVLFASEHGAFWEVGLIAGLLFNWWMIRTRSLADCILAHAVANGCLAAWVVGAGQWQFWL